MMKKSGKSMKNNNKKIQFSFEICEKAARDFQIYCASLGVKDQDVLCELIDGFLSDLESSHSSQVSGDKNMEKSK